MVAFGLLISGAGYAWEPGEVLPDAALETRARNISAQVRCLVCQNQSIDDSDADLAKDLRLIVRERLTAGDTDKQVYDYLVARYGEFILLKPPLRLGTALLWGVPVLLLLIGCFVLLRSVRRQNSRSDEVHLSSADRARVSDIIDRQ
ncbi:MAG: cytochrome c-type biogenesis protein [Rhizobiaceae bacterium]